MAAKLVVVAGPDEGREVPYEGTVEVGSEPGCDLVLTDAQVSRHHAASPPEKWRSRSRDDLLSTSSERVRSRRCSMAIDRWRPR